MICGLENSMKKLEIVCWRSATRWMMLLALFVTSLVPRLASAVVISHLGLNQKVLVICAKFSDVPGTRMTNAQWVSLLDSTVNSYLNKATNGQTSFQFVRPTGAGVPAGGWYDVGAQAAWPGTTGGVQLALNAARANINLTDVNRVFVITNAVDATGNPAFGGQTTGWNWMATVSAYSETTRTDGTTSVPVRQMCTSAANEWVAASGALPFDAGCVTMAHELGHQLGLNTHYSDITFGGVVRDVISPWSLMGFSPTLNQFLGWAKNERSFIPNPSSRVTTVGPPVSADVDTTVIIEPVSNLTSGLQVVRIPFTNVGASATDPFAGYVLEN